MCQSSGALTTGVSKSTGETLPLESASAATKAPGDWRTPRRRRADSGSRSQGGSKIGAEAPLESTSFPAMSLCSQPPPSRCQLRRSDMFIATPQPRRLAPSGAASTERMPPRWGLARSIACCYKHAAPDGASFRRRSPTRRAWGTDWGGERERTDQRFHSLDAPFGLRPSGFFRHSSFVIRYCPAPAP